ncbi:hypothetical protein [Streptomyces spongiicola]|nr:hypothetical protein [Streptomyces spongiicola]
MTPPPASEKPASPQSGPIRKDVTDDVLADLEWLQATREMRLDGARE